MRLVGVSFRNNLLFTPPDSPAIEAELDRILSDPLLARSKRLSAFLRFVVTETLAAVRRR